MLLKVKIWNSNFDFKELTVKLSAPMYNEYTVKQWKEEGGFWSENEFIPWHTIIQITTVYGEGLG